MKCWQNFLDFFALQIIPNFKLFAPGCLCAQNIIYYAPNSIQLGATEEQHLSYTSLVICLSTNWALRTASDAQQQSVVCFLAGILIQSQNNGGQEGENHSTYFEKNDFANGRRCKMLQRGVALILKHCSMINACLLSAMLLFAQLDTNSHPIMQEAWEKLWMMGNGMEHLW